MLGAKRTSEDGVFDVCLQPFPEVHQARNHANKGARIDPRWPFKSAYTRVSYPQVAPLKWFEQTGYDGHFVENMTVSVESNIGQSGGIEGVKLEEMVRITNSGSELVARFPFEDDLL